MNTTHPLWQQLSLSLLGGMILAFGYRGARFATKLESALLFLGLAGAACGSIDHWWVIAGIAVVSAVVGWKLGNAFYYSIAAVIGAMAGVVGMTLASGEIPAWHGGLASAILGAMLAVKFERPVVILGSSFIGAVTVALAWIPHQSGQTLPPGALRALMVTTAALTVAGCLVQARTSRPKATTPPDRRDP